MAFNTERPTGPAADMVSRLMKRFPPVQVSASIITVAKRIPLPWSDRATVKLVERLITEELAED